MLQIHKKIEQARISAGLTQDEIAEKLKIKRSTYQYWEQKTPSIDKIEKVAEALNLPKDYFFGSSDEKCVSHEINQETTYNERSLNNLTESNKVLAEANRTLAEANKTLAEANHVISKNHDELIQLTKMIVANSTASTKNLQAEDGPEHNTGKPGFGRVTPLGNEARTEKSKGKH